MIVVPSYAQDPDGVFNLMGGVVGFASTAVTRPKGSVNASFGVVESEVFRRVNAALGDRLPDYKRDYTEAVRWPFAHGVLARSASAKLTLPPEHLGWVQDVARRTVATIRDRGYVVHGDLDALVPDDSSARPLPPYDEAAVAEASITALANYAADVARRTALLTSRRPPSKRLGPLPAGRVRSIVVVDLRPCRSERGTDAPPV